MPRVADREMDSTQAVAPKPEKKPYVYIHPEISVYNEDFVKRFITPNLHDLSTPEKCRAASTEVAEQLYHFPLFTEEFCKLLIEECENCGKVRYSSSLP